MVVVVVVEEQFPILVFYAVMAAAVVVVVVAAEEEVAVAFLLQVTTASVAVTGTVVVVADVVVEAGVALVALGTSLPRMVWRRKGVMMMVRRRVMASSKWSWFKLHPCPPLPFTQPQQVRLAPRGAGSTKPSSQGSAGVRCLAFLPPLPGPSGRLSSLSS